MTREELKEHCEKQIEMCEAWAFAKAEEPGGKIYEEHKLILELLEQEPRWIPVSGRLPKEYEPVILSTDAEEIFIARYLGKMNDGTDCFDDEDGMMWEGDVTAWMPLPKSYKAESED